jgi:hypothetical protein
VDLDAVRHALSEVLETLELGVGDGLWKCVQSNVGTLNMWVTYHAGELSIATVGAGLAVSAKTSDLGEVKGELVLEPVDGVARAAGENTDEVVAGELARLWRS